MTDALSLRALKYFVAIADAGSLTGAARAISVAQPALSRQLRELEDDLGVQLLHRSSRGVRLTQAGVTLYDSAFRILADAQRVRERLTGQGHGEPAHIVLGTSPTLARLLVPGVFARCQAPPGAVRLTVREAFTPILLDWVERGVLDLAVVTNPEPGRAVAIQALLGEPFALVAPASRRMAPSIALADLARVPLLMTSVHLGIVEHQIAALGGHLTVQARIDSVDAIHELVLRGQGSTLMPVSVFKEARMRRLVSLSEVSGVQLNRLLVLATGLGREEHPALLALKDMVADELAELTRAGLFNFAPARQRGKS